MSQGAAEDGTVPAGDASGSKKEEKRSLQIEKEVETDDDWRRRKAINAACAFGILALAGISFFAPQLSFAMALALCVGLPFFRAYQNKEDQEDTSNV